jgi:hypothetical protein
MEFNADMMIQMDKVLNVMNEFTLPIDELDGIRVKFMIIRCDKDCKCSRPPYGFVICLYGTYDALDVNMNHEGALLYKSDYFGNLELVMKYIMIFLQNFHVDEYNGKIITKKPHNCRSELSQLFKKFDRIKVNGDECCVCKDAFTNTQTPCGHYVCIRCISKLPVAADDENYDQYEHTNEFQRKCPMCRETFTHLKRLNIKH